MKYRRRSFTEAELAQAKHLRKNGTPWRDLASVFNCDYETVRRAIDPGHAEMRAAQIREAKALRGGDRRLNDRRFTGGSAADRRPRVPTEVLSDRHDRASAPRTLTAILCGDPAPGQSALDKKRSGAMP